MIRNYLSLCLFGILACLISSIVAREAIIKGKIASIDEFPYQVAVLCGGKGGCSGGIISASHILTAAHCILKNDGEFLNTSVHIVAGTNSLQNPGDNAVTAEVAKIFVPRQFKIQDVTTGGDIAVLKLEKPLDFNKHKHLKPIALPTRGVKHYIGKTGKIAGFGWDWIDKRSIHDKVGGNSDIMLRYTEAHVLNDKDCQEGFIFKTINLKEELCARAKQHADGQYYGVCKGDSGAPLVVDGKTVIGVLSQSSPICTEKERAGLYTRVVHYLTFIENAMADRKHDDIRTHVFPLSQNELV